MSPTYDTVLVAANVKLDATLRDSAGNVLTGRAIQWTSSAPSLATVDTTGLVHALALGVLTVRASSGGLSDSASVTLSPKITVLRDLPSMFIGDTTILTAGLADALGRPLSGSPVTWTTGDSLVARVNSSGVVSGLSAGSAMVSASLNGGVGGQVVAVLQPRAGSNREIAFLREHQRPDGAKVQSLWLMQAIGSGQAMISTDSEYVNDFDWSWDGSRITLAYVNFNGIGRSGIFVVNADGSAEHQVTTQIGSPRWSPDGTRIAYFSAAGSYDIYTANPDGSGVQRLTFDGLSADPAWSPDGRQIAFRHLDATGALGLMHADGSHLRIDTLPIMVSSLFWSPDGKQLALEGFSGGGGWQVAADGSNPRRICIPSECLQVGSDWPPWSLDKSYFALADASGIQIVRSSDSTAIALPGAVTPRWSPDGMLIAFVSPADTGLGFPWIRTVHRDGTAPLVLISNDTTSTRLPVWRP